MGVTKEVQDMNYLKLMLTVLAVMVRQLYMWPWMKNRAYVHIKFDSFFRLKFHNFVIKQSLLMIVTVLVLHAMGYLMQFTEFV